MVAAVLVVFAPAVLGVRTLANRDTDRVFAPVRSLVVEALRAGRLPLWNPHEGTGMPLFAEGMHSVLHPVSLLAAAIAPASTDFLLLAYLVMAAVGAFVLALTLGTSTVAAAGAGIAFACSGYTASMTGNAVFLAGAASAPWVIAGAKVAGDGARWGEVATAVATATAFLSGDAQATIVAVAIGAALAFHAGGGRGLARATIGIAVGILLAGVQISATRSHLERTYRGLELLASEKEQWPLEPARVLELIIPGLFRGRLDVRPFMPVFAESVYVGAPVLVAAAAGVRQGRRRSGTPVALAAAFLLWAALGHHLGARQVLDVLPIWNRFRYPEKLMAPLALCLCALAALGIDRIARERLTPRQAAALAAASLATGVGWLVIAVAPQSTGGFATSLLGEGGGFLHGNLRRGLPYAALGFGALYAVDRFRRANGEAPLAVLSLLLAGAAAAAVPFAAHFGRPEARATASPMRLESDSPVPRLAHPALGDFDPIGHLDHFDTAARYATVILHPSANVAARVDTVDEYSPYIPRRLANLQMTLRDGWWRAARRFGVTHVVVARPHDEAERMIAAWSVEEGRLVQRDEVMGWDLWVVPHRAWALFAEHAVSRERPQDAHAVVLDLIRRNDETTVVVEAASPPPTAPGRVLHFERAPEIVRIDAESSAPGLLVVNDAYWPGWRAWIDGEETAILATDLLVRSVRWPAGRHTLVMRYAPPEIRMGLVASGLGGLLLAALALRALLFASSCGSASTPQLRG